MVAYTSRVADNYGTEYYHSDRLLLLPVVYITQKNVSKRSADITVRVKLDNGSLTPAQLVLENYIYTQEGKKVASRSMPIELTPQGTQSYISTFKLHNPHLWQGREDPYLYKSGVAPACGR